MMLGFHRLRMPLRSLLPRPSSTVRPLRFGGRISSECKLVGLSMNDSNANEGFREWRDDVQVQGQQGHVMISP